MYQVGNAKRGVKKLHRILTRAEYDSSPLELRELIDKFRLSYARHLAKEVKEHGPYTEEEVLAGVVNLHEAGFIVLVQNEDESIAFRFANPCEDGVHTKVCETTEETIASTNAIIVRWGDAVTVVGG